MNFHVGGFILSVLIIWVIGAIEVVVVGLALGVQVGDVLALTLEDLVLLVLRVVVGVCRWSVESTRLVQRLVQWVVIRIESVDLVVASI